MVCKGFLGKFVGFYREGFKCLWELWSGVGWFLEGLMGLYGMGIWKFFDWSFFEFIKNS